MEQFDGHNVRELLEICQRFEIEQYPPNNNENIHAKIRGWLYANPGQERLSFRRDSVRQRDEGGTTPFHMACRFSAPLDVITALVVDCDPEAATQADNNGSIALHFACAGTNAPKDVIAFLCDVHPEGRSWTDVRGRTALHRYLCGDDKDVSADGVRLLGDTGAAAIADENRMLPMHYACAFMSFGRAGSRGGGGGGDEKDDDDDDDSARARAFSVLEILLSLHPSSIAAQDKLGRTPLHFTCANHHRSAAPHVLAFLLSHGNSGNRGGGEEDGGRSLVMIEDNDGRTPLYPLAALGRRTAFGTGAADNTSKCLLTLLDFVQDLRASDFALLQTLPSWLRAEAFKNPSLGLRSALNRQMSKPLPMMILMLDFYFLMSLIVFFQLAASETVRCVYSDEMTSSESTYSAYLAMIFIGGFYFLLREVSQVLSLSSIGLFRSVWLRDPTNYVDVLSIGLTFVWFGLMLDSCGIGGRIATVDLSANRDSFQIGMALTSGLYWLSFLLLLRATSVDFAVFMGGMFHVMRNLFTFLICLGVVMVAFAQMFFLVFLQTDDCECQSASPSKGLTCPDVERAASFCTFGDSLLQVYFMLVGEIKVDVVVQSVVSTFLVCAYIFLVVVLLTNVLIAIVTEAYILVKNSSAAQVFWSNRFAFLAEVKVVSSVMFALCGRFRRSKGNAVPPPNADGNAARGCSLSEQHEERKRELWQALMDVFKESEENDLGFCCARLFEVVVVAVVIVWVLFGLVSAGLFWPPQVREYLLHQRLAKERKAVAAAVKGLNYDDRRGAEGLRVVGRWNKTRRRNHACDRAMDGGRADADSDVKRECNEIKAQNAALASELAEIKSMLLSRQRGPGMARANNDVVILDNNAAIPM